MQDGLAAATSDEVHITRDREYGLQPRRRGCMNYLHHQGPHKPLLAPADGQDHKQPGKTGGWLHMQHHLVNMPTHAHTMHHKQRTGT